MIGEKFAGRGLGVAAMRTAELGAANPAMCAIRVGHNPRNAPAATSIGALGFKEIGEKTDGETGTRDVLREMTGAQFRSFVRRNV